jgi:hypothetical protein
MDVARGRKSSEEKPEETALGIFIETNMRRRMGSRMRSRIRRTMRSRN